MASDLPPTTTTTTSSSSSHIAHDLLSRAHPAPETHDAIFTERIKQKPLLLRPTSPSLDDNRDRRRRHRLRRKQYFLAHQKPRPLSARQKRASRIYELDPREVRYETFKGLNRLWGEYVREILDVRAGRKALVNPSAHGSKLASADFHGAEVMVVRSRAVERVGIRGIVVRDTRFTFVVVTEGNAVKTIPKEHTVFRFEVPLPESEGETGEASSEGAATDKKSLVFELHGSQFENRPVDRANKKFKWRNIDDCL